MHAYMLSLIVVGAALAGCITGSDPAAGLTDPTASSCAHPFPCADGTEWPLDLVGPFGLGLKLTDPIVSHDGTPLETTIYVPKLPQDVKAPVILWSQPYTGGCAFNWWFGPTPCAEASDSDCIYTGCYRIDVKRLVEHGFAVAIVNVRGTGNSGGCFSMGGMDEQQDQVHLIEDLAVREWSNGRVAMYGHSYHGYTPWMAAIQSPPALKTIVASGLMTNLYTFYYTPQGSPFEGATLFHAAFGASINNLPPIGGGPEHAAEFAEHAFDRLCPEAYTSMSEVALGQGAAMRDASFWETRRLDQHFNDITASVLVVHGINDDTGHAYQEDIVWDALPADLPKRMILGQWRHDLPPPDGFLDDAPFGADWHVDTLLPWFDYFLKGVGDPADVRIGQVHHQSEGSYAWAETSSWPPADARDEVLYFTPSGLRPAPADASWTFQSASAQPPPLCDPESDPTGGSGVVLFATEAKEEAVTVAGNIMAQVLLSSDLPRGTVSLDLFLCSASGSPRYLTSANANLAFHAGGYAPQDFPVDSPVPVRFDFYSDSFVMQSGSRLVLALNGPGYRPHGGEPVYPMLTAYGGTGPEASHIVLPVTRGTLGGEAPTLAYAPRPFLPTAGAPA